MIEENPPWHSLMRIYCSWNRLGKEQCLNPALSPTSRDWICGCSREICPRVKFCMWFLCRLSKLGFHLSANRLFLKFFIYLFIYFLPTHSPPVFHGGEEEGGKSKQKVCAWLWRLSPRMEKQPLHQSLFPGPCVNPSSLTGL